MWKLIMTVVGVALIAIAPPSMAQDREFGDIYTECGLGAMIAPNTPGAAAVTNVTWDLGTTAISSNISSEESCQGGEESTAMFIHDAYDDLEKDLAAGEGTYLSTLMSLVGCEGEAGSVMTSTLRGDLAEAVADPGYSGQTRYQKAESLYNMVQGRLAADMAGTCSAA